MAILGGMRSMWLIVMFDLPTTEKKHRKAYQKFVSYLKKDGFQMMQYSAYMRHCASVENAQVHEKRINRALPIEGHVRTLLLTDFQFSKMKSYYGKMLEKNETGPEQLSFL
jgi:CRISPR-associated protein Cas2